MEQAFSESNRKKVMALHLRGMTAEELAANPAACHACGGVGHTEQPQSGFFRSICDRCQGRGII